HIETITVPYFIVDVLKYHTVDILKLRTWFSEYTPIEFTDTYFGLEIKLTVANAVRNNTCQFINPIFFND
ncbi:hypothetical protein ACLBQR_31545, partial [Klebsiella pneumoniae]